MVSSRKSKEELEKVYLENNEDKIDAVVICALHKAQNKLVLINQYRVPINKYIYELPAGLVDNNEDIETSVRRELKEETGLDVKGAEGGYMFTYKRENPGEGDNYFVDVYRFVMDIDENDVSFQEAEIDGYMFATKEQIEGFAAEGKFLHYDSIKQAFSFEK